MFLKITAALRSLVPHYLWRQILILRRCLIGRLINQPIIELVGLHWQGGTSNNSSRAYLVEFLRWFACQDRGGTSFKSSGNYSYSLLLVNFITGLDLR